MLFTLLRQRREEGKKGEKQQHHNERRYRIHITLTSNCDYYIDLCQENRYSRPRPPENNIHIHQNPARVVPPSGVVGYFPFVIGQPSNKACHRKHLLAIAFTFIFRCQYIGVVSSISWTSKDLPRPTAAPNPSHLVRQKKWTWSNPRIPLLSPSRFRSWSQRQ